MKDVSLNEPLLHGSTIAHALCTLKGDTVDAHEIVAEGRKLVGSNGVRENVLNRICKAAAGRQ